MKRYYIYALLWVLVGLMSCTNLDETVYSSLASETYITNSEQLNSVYTNMYAGVVAFRDRDRFALNELPADQFAWAQKGPNGYDGGKWIDLHNHSWNSEHGTVKAVWEKLYKPAAICNYNLDLFNKLDYSHLGLSEQVKSKHIAEAIILRSMFFADLLDLYGNIVAPTELSSDLPTQMSVKEAFELIVSNVKSNYDKLSIANGGDGSFGLLNQAAAQMLLARLYLNAESYGLEPMYDKCETICKDIIDGKYGKYSLADKWYKPFDYDNNYCQENIFGFNTNYTYFNNYTRTMYYNFNHPKTGVFFNFTDGGNNGMHLQPSYAPDGDLYSYEHMLGLPYERYASNDLRKALPDPKNGGGGMFLKGILVSPFNGDTVKGTVEYLNKPLNFVDKVARFSEVDPSKYGTLESSLTKGEENSGVRWVKYQMYPKTETKKYFEANFVFMRLSEIYYMMAECRLRLGESGYSNYVNAVKVRNFKNGEFIPYTDSSLTKDELLADMGREFIGEFLRRRALIRFGYFTSGKWWQKNTISEKSKEFFPIPESALGANSNLKQNPGY